jgi:hypothetical protein
LGDPSPGRSRRREGQLGGDGDVVDGHVEGVPPGLADRAVEHRLGLAQGAQRLGGAAQHDVGPMPQHPRIEAGESDEPAHLGGDLDEGEQLLGLGDDGAKALRPGRLVQLLRGGVELPVHVALHDGDSPRDIAEPAHIDTESEAVEQLGPQLALLRVHGADEDEVRGMHHRHSLSLHGVDAHGGGVEEDVDEVVVEEVDLVDVEDVAIGVGEDPRLEAAQPLPDGALDVDGPHHPVLGGVDGELDDAHGPGAGGQALTAQLASPALVAEEVAALRAAGEAAVLDDRDLGKEGGQGADRGGLGGAPLAADEHATDRRVDGVEDEGGLHRLLADQGREGQDAARAHGPIVARGRHRREAGAAEVGRVRAPSGRAGRWAEGAPATPASAGRRPAPPAARR